MEVVYSNSSEISHLTVEKKDYSDPNEDILDQYAQSFWNAGASDRFTEGCVNIIKFLKKNTQEKIKVRIGMASIEVFFRKYSKSIIPFMSSWETYKTIEVSFQGSRENAKDRWCIKLHKRAWERLHLDTIMVELNGYKDKILGVNFYQLYQHDREIINDILKELEKIYCPNSIKFITEDEHE